ncbi:MAG: MFS transporter [Chloroflexi bacterium]|nr:MFS transporter [Chloroflexota bacterium]
MAKRSSEHRGTALQLVLLLGLVSAFGDITYEGARSISGSYLALLGAGAGIVGLVAGLGEFVGYALHLLAGHIADRTRAYWGLTFLGYGLLICVPLLAFAGRWEMAALLLIGERVGKAIRSPSRDAILSHATHQIGRGWGFALHEALDQIGAVIGPLIFVVVFVAGCLPERFYLLVAAHGADHGDVDGRAYQGARARDTRNNHCAGSPRGGGPASASFLDLCWFYPPECDGVLEFPAYLLSFRNGSHRSGGADPGTVCHRDGGGRAGGLGRRQSLRSHGPDLPAHRAVRLHPDPVAHPVLKLCSGRARRRPLGGVMAIHETTLRAAVADIASPERRGLAYGLTASLIPSTGPHGFLLVR